MAAFCVAIVLNEIGFESITIGFNLVFVNEVMPMVLQLLFVLDTMRSEKIRLINEVAERLLAKCSRKDLRAIQLKFMLRLFVLITVRLIKFLLSTTYFNIVYAASTMISELVLAGNDFAFALCVEALESRVNESVRFVQVLLFSSQLMREVEREVTDFSVMRIKILQIYAARILITTIFNLILLVISLYWTFTRLVFNHFETAESYTTYLYLIAPALCIWTTFYSAHNCAGASRKLLSALFRKDKGRNSMEIRRTAALYLQLNHQHLRFPIVNVFELNMRSVAKIIATLSAFFVLIIQTFKKDFYQEWTSARMN